MGINGFQDFWITGSRFLFQRDPVQISGVDTPVPLLDLGRIEVASPSINPQEAVLQDGDGGQLKTLERTVISYDESYDITCSNLNLDNLALLFASKPPQSFTQSSSPVTGTYEQVVFKGSLHKVIDNSGNYVWGVASIQNVKLKGSPDTTLTLGTDYEIVSLERGLIRILASPATSMVSGTDKIKISYTPRAITGNRLLNPQDAASTVEGTGIIIWGRKGNTQQTVREARVSISPSSSKFDVKDYSNFGLKVSVLNDITASVPAGRLLYWLGTMPSVS